MMGDFKATYYASNQEHETSECIKTHDDESGDRVNEQCCRSHDGREHAKRTGNRAEPDGERDYFAVPPLVREVCRDAENDDCEE